MKTKFLYLFFITTLSMAQSKFVKGYYIDTKGIKIDCLIKNYDWKNNPTSFEIKSNLDGLIENLTMDKFNEIAIDNEMKFIKADVNIDTSSDYIPTLDSKKQSNFITKTVLLKVLVEGTNNLFVYEDKNITTKLFYNNKITKDIKQLIYKRYVEDSYIKQNETYKQQLINDVICDSKNISEIEKLSYLENDLIKYFLKVNACLGDLSSKEVSLKKEFKVNFYPLISVNKADMRLDLQTGNIPGQYVTENKTLFGLGFEIESVLPFNNYQWGIYVQPTYISNFTTVIPQYRQYFISPNVDINIRYNYFQVPFGVRRYIPFTNVSKLFINLSYSYTYVFNTSSIEINGDPKRDLGNSMRGNVAFGLGYQFKRMNLEFTKCLSINNDVGGDNLKLNYFSFGFKYNISKNK